MYNVKSNFQVKDIDSKNGILVFYPAIFGNIDSDGDVTEPGSWTKTIKERGPTSLKPRIKHLWQHKVYEPIGVHTELKEDNIGVYSVVKFGSDSFSRDKFLQHIDGIITEYSYGYEVIKSEPKQRVENGESVKYRSLQELRVWETSSVTWGANLLTETIEAKGNKEDLLTSINDRMDRLVKALKTGTYTDETCEQFEIELKQIQSIYIELIKGAEPLKSTPHEPDSSTLSDQQVKDMFNILIGKK